MGSKIPSDVKARYAKHVQKYHPKPAYLRNFVAAFLVGGLICAFGQALFELFRSFGLNDVEAGLRMAVVLIFLSALATGLGVYDELGRFAGAGSAIPITGFANSIVSPAMEFAREGYVLGMAAQLFAIAGPVIVYGVASAVVVGGLRYLLLQ